MTLHARGRFRSASSSPRPDRPPYTVVDCRRPSFSGRRCLLFPSPNLVSGTIYHATPRHLCTVPATFLPSSEDSSFQPFPSRLSVLHMEQLVSLSDTFSRIYYLLTHLLTVLSFRVTSQRCVPKKAADAFAKHTFLGV